MNTKPLMINPWPGQLIKTLSIAGLYLAVIVGCSPVGTQPAGEPTPVATQPQATPATLLSTATSEAPPTPVSTATSEALVPAGWETHTSQRCEYAISYPSEMQVTVDSAYSSSLGVEAANPDEAARNFVYVSVIVPEFLVIGEEGIYNYNPAETETLLNMDVGESKDVHEDLNVAGFTYERKPDTLINDHAAQTYENLQPWEFPEGTKEIRYYLSLNGCTYLIGGYLDTTGSNQPGAITEELFNQIVATTQLIP